jgi:hypothetical protein
MDAQQVWCCCCCCLLLRFLLLLKWLASDELKNNNILRNLLGLKMHSTWVNFLLTVASSSFSSSCCLSSF